MVEKFVMKGSKETKRRRDDGNSKAALNTVLVNKLSVARRPPQSELSAGCRTCENEEPAGDDAALLQ